MKLIPSRAIRRAPARPDKQGGMLLIEALFAIVVFSLGVLALIGFQASAIRASAEARSRSDATLVANQIISDIWAGDHTTAGLAGFVANNINAVWIPRAALMLPNGTANVDVSAAPIVVVTIRWQAPGDPLQHNLAFSTQINGIN
jgi:type IV pilus assembly protein PilV